MRTIGLLLLALSCVAFTVPAQSSQRRAPHAKPTAEKSKGPTQAEIKQKQRKKVEDAAVKEAIEEMKDANEKGKAEEEQRERTHPADADGSPTTARAGAASGPRAGAQGDRRAVRTHRPLSPQAQRKREDRAWRLRLERDQLRRDSALQEREREKNEIKELAKTEAEEKAADAPAPKESAAKDGEATTDKKVPVPPRAKPYGPRGNSKGAKGHGKKKH